MKKRKGTDGSEVIVVEDGDHLVIQPHESTTARWVDATIEARTVPIKAINCVLRPEGGCSVHVAAQDGNTLMIDGTEHVAGERVLTKDMLIAWLTLPEDERTMSLRDWLLHSLAIEQPDLEAGMQRAALMGWMTQDERDTYRGALAILEQNPEPWATATVTALESLAYVRMGRDEAPNAGRIVDARPEHGEPEAAEPPAQDPESPQPDYSGLVQAAGQREPNAKSLETANRIEAAAHRLRERADEVVGLAEHTAGALRSGDAAVDPGWLGPQPDTKGAQGGHVFVQVGGRHFGSVPDTPDPAAIATGLESLAGPLTGAAEHLRRITA